MNLPSHETIDVTQGAQHDIDLIEYRSVSAKSVIGLLLGFCSPLALISQLLWLVPLTGVAVCSVALYELRTSGSEIFGRRAALFGLALSLLSGTAAPSCQYSHRWLVRKEAKRFSQQWFQLLADGEPHKAYQFTLPPSSRQPLDDVLWEYYRVSDDARDELTTFVQQPLINTLLALKEEVRISYWETDLYYRMQGPVVFPTDEHLDQTYAVTFDDDHQKTTFFVRLGLLRMVDPKTDELNWRVVQFQGGVRPPRILGD